MKLLYTLYLNGNKWNYHPRLYMLNSNIDTINTLIISCNGDLVPFVNKATLLGLIRDDYLKFDQHTTSICSKIMWKLLEKIIILI